VLCGRILSDRFPAPDTYWKTTLKALGVKPQFSVVEQFFMGCLTEPMMPKLLLQMWLTFMDFEKTSSKFGSTTLSGGFCANRGA